MATIYLPNVRIPDARVQGTYLPVLNYVGTALFLLSFSGSRAGKPLLRVESNLLNARQRLLNR